MKGMEIAEQEFVGCTRLQLLDTLLPYIHCRVTVYTFQPFPNASHNGGGKIGILCYVYFIL